MSQNSIIITDNNLNYNTHSELLALFHATPKYIHTNEFYIKTRYLMNIYEKNNDEIYLYCMFSLIIRNFHLVFNNENFISVVNSKFLEANNKLNDKVIYYLSIMFNNLIIQKTSDD